MDKGKILVFGLIAFVIVVTVIYAVSVFSGRGEVKENVDFAIPEMVEKEQVKDDYNSRLKNANANAYQEPEQKKDIEETVQFKTYEGESSKEVKHSQPEYNETSQYQQRKVVKTESKKIVSQEEKKEETTIAVEEKKVVKNEEESGFGIVMSGGSRTQPNNANSNNSTQTVIPKGSGFIPAILEEDSQIKNGSSVVFILLEDCTFDGVEFKKNSFLYAQSLLRDNVFDLYVYQIMNSADSRVYNVNNVSIYNENFKKGLPTGGALNESVKEGINQTSTETANNLTADPTLGGASTTIGIAAKTINNTIRALSSKKEVSINRKKGYKIYIKQDQ